MCLRRAALAASWLLAVLAAEAAAPVKLPDAASSNATLPSGGLPVTPAPLPKTAPAILEMVAQAVLDELKNSPYQGLNALAAFATGIVLIVDGDFSFRWVVVCAVFLVTAVMAMNQVTALWGLSRGDALRNFVGLEAGAIGGFAALRGFHGVEVWVGALLGAGLAHVCQALLASHGLHLLSEHRWCLVIFYSMFVLSFIVMFSRKKHLKSLAVISAGLGGAFCASAIAFAVTEIGVRGYMNFLQHPFPGLSPKGGTWVEFLCFLFWSKAPDVGLFAGSKYNSRVSTDRVADVTLWLIFWIVGASYQLRKLRQSDPAKELEEPLLEKKLDTKLGELPTKSVP
eukprot:TRINITY_DN54829_c0_g1_i1.p1 TRINITY_DN54829_c0_g1~~TRINITY_DN54829_c0_g1_i1.p1  ORF type:complete len:364 (+),score=80.37 TRINITY_DN54829_c0_g1_i1:71-1093(+)